MRGACIGAAAVVVALACLYVPLGICSPARCNYEGHGWLFKNYYRTESTTKDNIFAGLINGDDRRDVVVDRWFGQLGAAGAIAGLLVWASRPRPVK